MRYQVLGATVSAFVKVERDVKVTMEAALGLIGGTMGLFTGFSIISGVEIIYFALKILRNLIKSDENKVS